MFQSAPSRRRAVSSPAIHARSSSDPVGLEGRNSVPPGADDVHDHLDAERAPEDARTYELVC